MLGNTLKPAETIGRMRFTTVSKLYQKGLSVLLSLAGQGACKR